MGQFIGNATEAGDTPTKEAFNCLTLWAEEITRDMNMLIRHHKKALTDAT